MLETIIGSINRNKRNNNPTRNMNFHKTSILAPQSISSQVHNLHTDRGIFAETK